MAKPSAAKLAPEHLLALNDATRLEAVFASIGEGAIVTDEKGLITRVNRAALTMLGYRKSELLRKRFPEKIVAVHENGAVVAILDRPIVKAFMTGQAVSERMSYRRKDGSLLPVTLTVSPIIMRGKPIGAIEVFRDLTTEIENDKLKSDFISIASHQLRTPLSAINMYTRMLQGGMAGELSAQQRAFTEIVLTSVERMNELIDTLLNITRIEAGGLTINPQPLELNELFATILTEFRPAAAEKKIQLTHDLAPDLPVIISDSLLLREVCANLLSNAIKYTPEHGTVHVRVEQTPVAIICSIRDSGYGIPEADQKHIFSKFFRAENISKQDVSGTGLGLYLTKAVAENLGGEIWFESVENKGSIFYFSLPL